MYYAMFAGVLLILLFKFPALRDYFPIGGIGDLAGRDTDSFEPVYSSVEETVLAPHGAVKLAIASIGAAVLIVPVSWIYFITSRTKKVDQSFVQTSRNRRRIERSSWGHPTSENKTTRPRPGRYEVNWLSAGWQRATSDSRW